jgi:hypothetical protein
VDRHPGKPRVLSDRAWFYEQPNGLGVVIEVHRNGKHVETAMVDIPWRKVCAAVDRHRKIKAANTSPYRKRAKR